MSMQPNFFMSTDAGAPAVSGTLGSLINVLDAVLVTGYGTGPSAKAPAGWTKVWSSGNQAVYRNDPVSGSGMYIHVNDAGSGSGGARDAIITGYHDWDPVAGTGTNPFPKSAQIAAGIVWKKSNALDATARAWIVVANEQMLYLGINGWGTVRQLYCAGDPVSFRAGDASHFMVSGGRTQNAAKGDNNSTTLVQQAQSLGSATPSGAIGGALAAAHDGTVSRLFYFLQNAMYTGAQTNTPYGSSSFTARPYPSLISGGLDICPITISEGALLERATMRGVYAPLHAYAFTDLATFPAAGPNGGTLLVVNYRAVPDQVGATDNGQVVFELGVDW